MKRKLQTVIFALGLAPGLHSQALDYPEARRSETSDVYHGEEVADPYRWLEEQDSEETSRWVDAQEQLLDAFVAPIEGREAFVERTLAFQTYASRSTPVRRGEREFFSTTAEGGALPVIRVGEPDGTTRVVLDPAERLGFGERMRGWGTSPRGSYVTYGHFAGADAWGEQRVIDVDSGELLEDGVRGVYGGLAWLEDESGFYYTWFEPPTAGEAETQALSRPRVRFHDLGTDPSSDAVVFELPDRPDWLVRPLVTRDGRYVVVQVQDGTGFTGLYDELWVGDLESGGELELLVARGNGLDGRFAFEGNLGTTLLLRTSLDAPNLRVVAVDAQRPGPTDWRELVPETRDALRAVSVFDGLLVLQYTRDAQALVEVRTHEGEYVRALEPPTSGRYAGFGDEPDSLQAFGTVASLYDPGSVYRVDLPSGEATPYWRPEVPQDIAAFEQRTVFYRSLDGTRVPLTIVGRRDVLASRAPAPLYLYAYGYGGWAAFPWYQPSLVAWLELGGLYAMAHVRGGGEYGEAWELAGKAQSKQTGIDDFVAASEFLIDAGYTAPDRLVANGGSASGVLAAAAVMQRPELYGAALIDVALLDMLRYHRFTGSKFMAPNFGTADDEDEFRALRAYSPVHNVDPELQYPPILVTVGEDDATTPPLHGYKLIAELQARARGGPFLLELVRDGGHGLGRSPRQRAETAADQWAFVERVLPPGAFEPLR